MRSWGRTNDQATSSWLVKATLIILGTLILELMAPGTARAVEPGYGRVRFWSGIENTGAQFKEIKYLALGVDLNQTTLNYGKWQFNFLGLGEDWGAQPRLGYGLFGFRNMGFRDSLAADLLAGDTYLQTGVSSIPFEHFVVPSQNLRGLHAGLYDTKFAVGAHAGNLTFLDFFLAEAYTRSDTNLAGFFFRLGEPKKVHVGLGFDGFSDPLGNRYLSNFNLVVPLGKPRAKGHVWYDTRSRKAAGVVGLRQDKGPTQWEVGVSHVPYNFIYLTKNATLASGQSLGFATLRRSALKYNYYLEGSGGVLSFGEQQSTLLRGTLGGGWRFRLRDTLSGSMGISWQGGDGKNNWHLLPSLRYSRVKGPMNFYTQLTSDYYTIKLVSTDGTVVAQPTPLGGDQPEASQTTTIFRVGTEMGFDYSPPGKTRWGGNVRFDNTQTTRDPASSFRTATGEVRIGKYLPYDTVLDFSFRSGYSWGEGQTSALHSGGLRLSINAFENWSIFLEGRIWYSKYPQEVTGFASVPNPAYSMRSGVRRRMIWGEPAPVYGVFPQGGLRGVGTVSGVVFQDNNRNGVYDAGDLTVKEAVLRLDDGFVVETDAQGRYLYPNVASGEHSLQLDPESYPVNLTCKFPEGKKIKLFPREEIQIDWPLSGR